MRLSHTIIVVLFATLLTTLLSSPAVAQQHKWVEMVKTDWHRMNHWPKPFTLADRQALRAPFAIMIQNGWERQNTLGSYLFDPETHQILNVGKRQLHWIITQAPQSRRQVFVEEGATLDVTAARVDSVEQMIAEMTPNGKLWPVQQTHRGPVGVAAGVIDTIYRKYDSTIMDPRLSTDSGGVTGGM